MEAARAIGYDEGVVNHLSQLSYAYNRQGDYQRGLEAAQQAMDFVEKMEMPDRNLLAISLEYVAYNLLDMKRNAEADSHNKETLNQRHEETSAMDGHREMNEMDRQFLIKLRRY